MSGLLPVRLANYSIDDVVETMVHSLVVPITESHPTLLVVHTEVVNEYILIDPYMIDGVLLSLRMDK